ncbi:sigma factor-like helix-turn-helix DNA-binding protein [Dyadobacter subterraneus]|nr:sigma factor-like helix-turn-helix DNA-binding protein [Dyadobacter subterraneus]
MYLSLFKRGDESAMNFVYQNSFHSLKHFGINLIRDEFLVTCLLHECYLKAWSNRHRMESLPHIYRFIRMNLRWQILRNIEKSRHTIYGQTLFVDHLDKRIGDFEDLIDDKETWEEEIKKLDMTTESMQYLSAESRQIVSLYFLKGFTHKQIADRLGKSIFHVSEQLSKSVKQIKSIVHVSKKEIKNNSVKGINLQTGILDPQQSKIYDLRKNHKLSFREIANKLGLPQTQVQQHYIKAHQLLQSQSVQKSNNRF